MKQDIQDLLAIMRRLRDPERGCPWDLRQDFRSIAPYTIEEAYEVADAIERDNLPHLKDELGDLLLQVVFHAQMASERSAFDFSDVVGAICAKMTRRHPHVFGGEAPPEHPREAWEQAKEREREGRNGGEPDQPASLSLMDGIPAGMAELQRAVKLQQRAARVGFDWATPQLVLDKLEEEVGELREAMADGHADGIEDELGDLLFVLANLARQLGVDPAAALRRANLKFETRFRAVERAAGDRDNLAAMPLAEMEGLWQRVKADERQGGDA